MSFSVLDAAKRLVTNELVTKAAFFLDESQTSVSKAFSGVIPSIFGAIAHNASTNEGANSIFILAKSANDFGFSNMPDLFFENDNAGTLLNKGAKIFNGLFSEDKIKTFTKKISNFSGIQQTSANTLLSMATPVVLALLGRHAVAKNFKAQDLSSFLKEKNDDIQNAMPRGLSLNSIFHGLESKEKNVREIVDTSNKTQQRAGGELKWLLPLLIPVFASWYFLGKGCTTGRTVADEIDSLKAVAEHAYNLNNSGTNALGKIDPATGYFMYNKGKIVKIDLPDGAGKLEVGENSTENKLYNFLIDRSGKLNEAKGNWFEFTSVNFKAGGTQLDLASINQLKNMVAITKAFPTAEFKIGAYTDNTGNSIANIDLSQKRADVVMMELKNLGVSPSAITGAKGYGSEEPLQDNATPEGRAINCRIAIDVKAK